jgi:predicted RNA-binding Zn-ribbon protein involved in translation (DUF1610 family)
MSRHSQETVGVRYTGWAALDRDPQEDSVEFDCPRCGQHGFKSARRDRNEYHFTDGFLQDMQGEMSACRKCRTTLHIAPIVLVHDQHERRRFAAVFATDLTPIPN